MGVRKGFTRRKTAETEIEVELTIEGEGKVEAGTGVRFLDHMLETLGHHAHLDLKVSARGDLTHHLVEDVAMCLGEALGKALGERRGIGRFGYAIAPMDDSLALAAVDLVKRPYAHVELGLRGARVEDVASEDLTHFIRSFAHSLQATIHVKILYGLNDHHKVEAAFKALAIALRSAAEIIEPGRIPSTKGEI